MHVMVDIETIATSADAVIIQVGAKYFEFDGENTDFPGIDVDFLMDVAVGDQVKRLKRVIDPHTISWWMDDTKPDARVSVLSRDTSDSLFDVMNALNDYISRAKLHSRQTDAPFGVWANSPTFDLSIIRHAMVQLGIEPCWSYGREYDVRTLRFLNNHLELGVDYDKANGGIAHNALDDSKGQSKFVKSVFRVLNSRSQPPTKSV